MEKAKKREKSFQVTLNILQTLAVTLTLPLIYFQITQDLDQRKRAETMDYISSMPSSIENDIRICGLDDEGNIRNLSPKDAVLIYRNVREKAQLDKTLAQLEFYATGVNHKVFDFKVASKLNGGFTIDQYKRYFEYMQLVVNQTKDKSHKLRIFDQFEAFVMKLNKTRKPKQDLPVLKRD